MPHPKRHVTLLCLLAALALCLLVLPSQPAAAEGELELRRNMVVRAVEKARPAIVSIRTNRLVTRTWYDFLDRPRRRELFERDGGLGSGVIFHPDGYIITNAHVISSASKIFVGVTAYENGGRAAKSVEHRALPLAIDIADDLAILRLLPEKDGQIGRFPYLELGRSDDLLVGETIIAMGHPFRLGLTVTQGIVSGLNRKLKLRGQTFDDFMQVDAAVNPGNSGGPLFDVTGRWIGVNTAIYNRASGAEGIGFAIPANRVRSLIASSFKRRVVRGDWLGIEFQEGTDGAATVQRTYPKGPAASASLASGDRVVAVNGQATPTFYDLRMALVSLPALSDVTLSVASTRGQRVARVPLAPVPTERLSVHHLGFTAEDTGEFSGVVVTDVRPGGPGDKMHLQRSDIIEGLGPWEIRSTEDLLMFLQFVSAGDLVDVKIRRRAGANELRLDGRMRAE